MHCAPGGKVVNKRVCARILLSRIICHHLRLALIQIKRAINFLLLQTELAQTFFMLKRPVKLLPVISERFYLSFKFGLSFFSKRVKTAQGIFNAGYRA